MEIRFSCHGCGRKLKADPDSSGQRADCPDCGTELRIPFADASSADTNPSSAQNNSPKTTAAGAVQQTDPHKGKFTCPTCWLKFDVGGIMHISVHDQLRGDPILGEDVQQRFYAIRFNDANQALDAMGMVCTELACPHCRRRIPNGLLDEPHHIFSLVGDQSAGKSYYLSVLSKVLPAVLFSKFKVTMQDADPTGNAPLNDMRNSMFAAESPEKIKIVKTVMEGAMYERFPRQGRMVALPRPFIYTLGSSTDSNKRRCSFILYDNAGEHFQPGVRLTEQPGALHVASASSIFFLFDPFNNPEFRRAMSGTKDPQIEKPVVDQQDIILSEMRSRILGLNGLPTNHKQSQPLGIIVGKSDAWLHLLPPDAIRYPVIDQKLDLNIVRQNSEAIRNLLLNLCPSIVANAEALSSDVCYFAASAFGHTPIKLVTGGESKYLPDPQKLQPFHVEIPLIWSLAKLAPDLFPVVD